MVKNTSPIAFRDTMVRHRDDRTQRFIDLMTLELGLYDRSGLTLFKKSRIETNTEFFDETAKLEVFAGQSTSTPKVRHFCTYQASTPQTPLPFLARFVQPRLMWQKGHYQEVFAFDFMFT